MSEYSELKTIKARVEYLRTKLATDDRWAVRAVLKIYEAQTLDEQSSGQTSQLNGIGYSGVDSEIMSSFAEQIKKGRTMSVKQMALIHKKIVRYAKQLERVAR